jgi:mycothiol synthase
VRLRAPTVADAAGIASAMNELGAALHGGLEAAEGEVRLWLEAPDFDPVQDAVVAEAEHGSIMVYGAASDPSREGRLIWLDVSIRPGVPAEVGAAVIDELELRADTRLAPAGRLKAYVHERDTVLAGLLQARGYRVVRHSFRMEADLAAEPPVPEWPDGIAVRTFRPGEDDRRVYEVQEETFADQVDHEPLAYEEWRHWSFSDPFDPALWFLAEDGDQLAGILLARSSRSGDETLGWVSVLGVRRPWRRRGLGRALLLHAFRELRARGKPRAGLGVDGSHPTGAVELYRRAGMRVVRRYDHWEKDPSVSK